MARRARVISVTPEIGQADGEIPQRGHACGPFPAYPVPASSAYAVSRSQCAGPVPAGAGDGVDDLPADLRADGIVAAAAVPRGLPGVREAVFPRR
jgi:hypothetical protein